MLNHYSTNSYEIFEIHSMHKEIVAIIVPYIFIQYSFPHARGNFLNRYFGKKINNCSSMRVFYSPEEIVTLPLA